MAATSLGSTHGYIFIVDNDGQRARTLSPNCTVVDLIVTDVKEAHMDFSNIFRKINMS